MSTVQFYAQLPKQKMTISQVLGDPALFSPVPADWFALITDIRDSTRAVADGAHQNVNLVATASIIAVLNLAKKARIELPFFFGGDGATLLVPPALQERSLDVLRQHQENTKRNFDMDLRVLQVGLQEIYAQGHTVKIAKVQLTPLYAVPVVLGHGLRWAEEAAKERHGSKAPTTTQDTTLDLEGMECRWHRVRPPQERQEVVSLLVDAYPGQDQAEVFSAVMQGIDTLYGPILSRNPISTKRLRLEASLGKINLEMRTKLGRFDGFYLLKHWFLTMIGKLFYGKEKHSRNYLENLVQLADTLVIDGRINTVMSGTARQRKRLEEQLVQMEADQKVIYGLSVSPASIMSCYVRDRKDQHVHFVDGSEGGYTGAARELKEKRSKLSA